MLLALGVGGAARRRCSWSALLLQLAFRIRGAHSSRCCCLLASSLASQPRLVAAAGPASRPPAAARSRSSRHCTAGATLLPVTLAERTRRQQYTVVERIAAPSLIAAVVRTDCATAAACSRSSSRSRHCTAEAATPFKQAPRQSPQRQRGIHQLLPLVTPRSPITAAWSRLPS